jgi:hypothetical protein
MEHQKELDEIVNMLAKHLGSIEAALLWLNLDNPSMGRRPIEIVKEGRGSLIKDMLEQQWGPNPHYS